MDSRAPSASGPPPDEERIRAALREVMDPEAGFNIVDLGLIYRVAIAAPIGAADISSSRLHSTRMCASGH